MKKNKASVTLIIFLAAFILIPVSYVTVLSCNYNRNKKEAEFCFSPVTRTITDLIQTKTTRKDFADEILKIASSYKSISAIQLQDGNKLVFAYPSSHLQKITPGKYIKIYSTEIFDSQNKAYQLTVSFSLLRASFVYKTGLIALAVIFLILIALFITAIVSPQNDTDSVIDSAIDSDIDSAIDSNSNSVIDSKIDSDSNSNSVIDSKIDSDIDSAIDSDSNSNSVIDSDLDSAIEKNLSFKNDVSGFETEKSSVKNIPSEGEKNPDEETVVTEPPKKDITDSVAQSSSDKKTSAAAEKNSSENTKTDHEEEEIKIIDDNPAMFDAPVYSPITGFCWETTLIDVLSKVLTKASQNQIEVALFTIRIPQINWANPKVDELKQLFIDSFKNKDFIFNYTEDGIAAIMTDITMDQAFALGEKIHIAATAILAKAGLEQTLGIGITLRNTRIVSAERFLKEAGQALLHGLSDASSPVVEFKVDPKKYREFIMQEKKTEEN